MKIAEYDGRSGINAVIERKDAELKRLLSENERYRRALEWYSKQAIDDDNRAWNALHPQDSK